LKPVHTQNHKVTVKYQKHTKPVKTHSNNSFKGRKNTNHRTQSKRSFGGSKRSVFKGRSKK
jgi:hypothetical protein